MRITIQAEDSNVELEALSFSVTVDADPKMQVKLNLPDERKYSCTIYLDNAQYQRIELKP